MSLSVWAPGATSVLLDLPGDGARQPMDRSADGWWSTPTLPDGTDYGFIVDDSEPLPDPRSPWQPDGVHSHSRSFDAAQFTWTDQDWDGAGVTGSVIYELHIGTFTTDGTLDAAISRLDHLAALGVDVVELMPVAAFGGEHGWGYDGVALYAVQESYGGPRALQRFVDAAHRRGLGVVLDVVYNHLGPSGNYLSRFGPYFTDRHHTPWGQAVNLDGPGSAAVRDFIVSGALRWFSEFHIDGLRLDAVHELQDDSAVHVLAELATATSDLASRLGRPLSLIAESDMNDAVMVTAVSGGGFGMDGQWADDVHHALHAYLTGERHGYYVDFGSGQTLAKALTDVFVHNGTYSTFRDKDWGAPVPTWVSGHRFVASLNTHDQVGNRALGDRPSASLDPGRLAIGAALLLGSHYTPMLFMGEEWAATTPWMYFTDHAEPELARAVAQGRRREFGDHGWAQLYGKDNIEVPDPQAPETFTGSKLNWNETNQPPQARVLAFYTAMIALRRAQPDLACGDRSTTRVTFDDDAGWFVMNRGTVAIVVNTGPAQDVPLPGGADNHAAFTQVLLAWDQAELSDDGGSLRVGTNDVAVVKR